MAFLRSINRADAVPIIEQGTMKRQKLILMPASGYPKEKSTGTIS